MSLMGPRGGRLAGNKEDDMPTILDGKLLAKTMQQEIARDAAAVFANQSRRPGLAPVLVGDSPASKIYVRNKRKACADAGLESWLHELPADTTQLQLLDVIATLNADRNVNGILVQLPLPKQIDEAAIIRAVSP